MKKTPPAPKKAVPAKLSDAAEKKLARWGLLLALIAPLIDTLVIFPLRQIILANSSGSSPLYEIFYQVTDLLNLAAFFLLMALAIYCAVADSTRTLGRIIALHGIASVFITVLLRMGIYLLMAWLDSALFLSFELCNKTLNALTENSGSELMSLSLTLFLSQVILFAILGATALLSLRKRQRALAEKADLSPAAISGHFEASPIPGMIKIGLVLYGLFALANQVVSTVISLIELGVPGEFSTLLTLIVPYFLLAIHCLLGYLVLEYGTRYIAKSSSV